MLNLAHTVRLAVVSTVLLSALPVVSASEKDHDPLRLQPQSVEADYCTRSGGAVVLHLRIWLTYANRGDTTILVPRVRRVSEYVLLRTGNTANQREVAYRWRQDGPPMLDTSKLNIDAPDPKLFDRLPAGSTLPSMQSIDILLGSRDGRTKARLSGDYSLELYVDHWPGARGPGDRLRKEWISQGLLYMSILKADPITVHIESDPDAKACRFRID
ncbi:hypothetical protein [Paludibaculum fermentans]|uniref:hypothetical protein n=1 Tax=Paludibaculum fermentans TaxID=1473598 RepID=UPI003EB6CD01